MCFGLNRDIGEKNGQIAHLDRDNGNPSLENLAYLCFHHHDAYDSTRSQSKGFSMGEVKEYRSELRNMVQRALNQEIRFGTVMIEQRDPYAGHYVRNFSSLLCSAELDITPLPDTVTGDIRYFVSGFALDGGHREAGPNIGSLEFVAEIHNGRLHHTFLTNDDRDPHEITIQMTELGLRVDEENEFGVYGFGVNFEGDYQRAEKLDYADWGWRNDDARRLFGSDEDRPSPNPETET
jgi:hypothetical protein